jgi:uncharacterized lipoprotein
MNRFAFLLLLPLTGCVVNDLTAGALAAHRCSDWYETGQVKKPREDLARTIRELLSRQGYKTPNFEATASWIETDWEVNLSPRFREGTRSKLEVEIQPLGADGFNVRSRSWFEVNNEMQHPTNPDKAVWVGAAVSEKHRDRIPEAAMRFDSMLRLRLFGLNQ